MKSKIKNVLIDLLLVMVVLLLLLLFHAGFIAGPLRAMEKENKLYVEAYEKVSEISNTEFMNRFSLSDIYYVVKYEDELHWFNQAMDKVGKQAYMPYDNVFAKAETLGFKESEISYGVFNDKVVYALEKKGHIVFLDLESHDIVFEFGG